MNRTGKLMTAITTSLLFAGTTAGTRAVPAFAQTAAQTDDSWKTDPNVAEAAATIHAWILGQSASCHHDASGAIDKTKTKPVRQDAIVKQFPQFDPALVQKGLNYELYKGEIKRMGDGSEDNPFCYCVPAATGG